MCDAAPARDAVDAIYCVNRARYDEKDLEGRFT